MKKVYSVLLLLQCLICLLVIHQYELLASLFGDNVSSTAKDLRSREVVCKSSDKDKFAIIDMKFSGLEVGVVGSI